MTHLHEIGVRTTPLILLVGMFSGMVLGLQGYHTLVRFGSESLLGSFVALTIIREIGPVFTAIMIVGQAGSAITAELGTQRNLEQIDALHVMRISPLAYLVGPRLLATLVAFPILNSFFCLIGIAGGYITGVKIMGLEAGVYRANVVNVVNPSDIYDSMLKVAVFGVLTMTVCTFEGYYTHKRSGAGVRGVSRSATRAVVYSSVLILASDYVITSFLL